MKIKLGLLLTIIILASACSEKEVEYSADEIKKLQIAAQQNDRSAQKSLIKYFERKANQGDAVAQNDLGYMYKYGLGVEKNVIKAVELYGKAADQGDANGQYNLGIMYFHGLGVEKNLIKAAELYQKAADQGDANAQYDLAIMYDKGEGVEKNLTKAVELYEKAAIHGHLEAKNRLEHIKNHLNKAVNN